MKRLDQAGLRWSAGALPAAQRRARRRCQPEIEGSGAST